MRAAVFNQQGEKVGTTELPHKVFGLEWNAELMRQAVYVFEANRHLTPAHAKGRSEVRGGGKKPWRQKGTGRARHGSSRSPLWRGGGVTHGPKKEKVSRRQLNKKMKKKALYTALSAKARENEIVVLDTLGFSEQKTRHAATMFSLLSKQPEFSRITRGSGVLVALPERDVNTSRAFKNLPYVGVIESRNLNAYDVLQYEFVLFPKRALEGFKE